MSVLTPDPRSYDPDWYADPCGGHQLRFYDGTAWTDNVADAGVQSLSPIGAASAAAPPAPSSPPLARSRSPRKWGWAVAVLVALVAGVLIGRSTKSDTRAPVATPTTSGTPPGTSSIVGATTTTVAVAAGGSSLSFSGTGDHTSQPFTFPGHWQLAWTYTCAGGSAPFVLTLVEASGQPAPGAPRISATGETGSGTESNSGADNLVFKIVTTCSWTVNLSG